MHENLQGIAPRGINYWESRDRKDRRLLYQRNHQLEALDALTGKPILTFGKDGAVNLREGFAGRDPATVGRVQSSTPGKIFENLILLGSATGENYMATPGDLRAYDVVTGKEAWRFRTIPHPGEFGYDTWPKDAYKYVGGTNTWGEITVDAARGIAYFPTGSPTYDYYGADRPGANLFGTSLVALDARTGKRLWHFQMVHHDLWDYDNCAAPQLTTIRRDGKTIDVVAQAGKTGFLYVFDRVTGEPIWPIEERPVPKSDIPGEQAWPTQPFPTAPPPFAAQTLSSDDVNPYVLSPAEQDEWRKRIANARNQGLFTPPALIDTIAIPGANGGANWGNTAAHPTNGTVYVQSINVPSIYRLSLEEPGRAGGPGRGGAPPAAVAQGQALYTERCQSCHGPDLRGTGTLPSLVDVTGRLSPDALREVITGGRQAMPPFRDFTNVQMEAVIAFLGSAARRPRRPGAAAPAALARRSGRGIRRRPGRASGRARWRRHGRRALPDRRRCAGRALLHGLRPQQHDRQAAVLDADRVRSQHRHDQVAGAAPAMSRARRRRARPTPASSRSAAASSRRRPDCSSMPARTARCARTTSRRARCCGRRRCRRARAAGRRCTRSTAGSTWSSTPPRRRRADAAPPPG